MAGSSTWVSHVDIFVDPDGPDDKQRVREIDLEAHVMDDDDGEEDGDSYTSAWDGRSPSKKSRWTHPHDADTTREIPLSSVWPRDLGSGLNINGDALDISERQQTHFDGGYSLFSRSRLFTGIDLQLAIPTTESSESKHQGEVEVQQIQQRHHNKKHEPGLQSSGVQETVDAGTSMKQRWSEVQIPDVKAKALKFSTSAASMLYPHVDRQDDKLHSFLQKQGALLDHTEVDVRLEATRIIGERLGSVKESATRNLLIDSMQKRLWKEVELPVNLALVKLLSITAVVSCLDDKKQDKERSVQMAPSQSVALILLQYIKSKDVQSSPMKSALKLQILRALHVMGNLEEIMDVDTLQDLAVDQLGSPNARFREWGILLLVACVRDKRIDSSPKKGGPENHRSRAFSGRTLKGWSVGQSLMHSLLEYTRDPHPRVREAVISGLLNLHAKGFCLDPDTYKHAIALFKDSVEGVRIHAIRLVCLCTKELSDGAQSGILDNAFLRLCSMMTDTSVSVKQEVCNTLGEMTGVSDSLLLQSLSKKVLTTSADKEPAPVPEGDVDAATLEEKNLLSWCAGAFVVALEDEFWEVRLAGVKALAKLGIASGKMASGALELVSDMINDDSFSVRQQTIQSLTSLARAGRLVIDQTHLHMFLGVLEDSNVEIRKAGHDLLSSITQPSISTFQATIRTIFASFDKHPEDEKSLFTTLEKLGVSHASHTECITSELLQEVIYHVPVVHAKLLELKLRGLLNKESGLDDPQCVGILVLLLAAATSNVKIISAIPPHILTLPRLISSRFRSSLSSLVVQPTGFKSMRYTWFSKTSSLLRSSDSSELRVRELEHFNSLSYQDGLRKQIDAGPVFRGTADENGLTQRKPSHEHKSPLLSELHNRTYSRMEEDEIFSCVRHTLSIALNASPLLEVRAFKDVLQRLRKGLQILKEKFLNLRGVVTFCSIYLNCLEVVVEILASFTIQGTSHVAARKSGLPHDLLLKLEHGVKHLLYRFLGLSYEQLVQVHELYALVFLWKLVLHPKEALHSDRESSLPLQELGSIINSSKRTSEDETKSPSSFLRTIQEKILNTKDTSLWRCAREVALAYWPGAMSLVAPINEVWADMKVPGPGFDHRIEFVPGLPLGISIDITLHNIPERSSLWIQFAVDSSAVQYRYLDIGDNELDSAFNVRQLSTILQLDTVQAGASCISRICIVLEGMEHQGNPLVQGIGRGPKGSVVPLCNEKEANLINLLIKERSSKLAPPVRR